MPCNYILPNFLGVMQLLGGVASKLYGPHVRRGLTGILRKRSREQLGNDLRRAVRELICDENFDAGMRHVSD